MQHFIKYSLKFNSMHRKKCWKWTVWVSTQQISY